MSRRIDYKKPFENGIINEGFLESEENNEEITLSKSAFQDGVYHREGKKTFETIEIEQGDSDRIGIKLGEGMTDDEDNAGRIYIKCIKPGSPASERLKPGDRIVSINGASTANFSKGAAMHLLRKASQKGSVLSLTIDRNTRFSSDSLDEDVAYRLPNLKQQWFQELEAVFSAYDTKGSGTMKTRDFRKALRLCGYDAPQAEVHLYMIQLGLVGSKTLTFRDYYNLMSAIVTEEEHGKELMQIYGEHHGLGRGMVCTGDSRHEDRTAR